MIIHPKEKLNEAETDGGLENMREHGVWERTRSEIWRI